MSGSHTYSVILEPIEDGGFFAHIPAFPEVSAEGETEEETLAAAKEGIERLIAYRVERGMPIPPESVKPAIHEVTVTSAA